VDAGDAVLFKRGVVHTFTAPLGDLTLLSYHAPFFEFDDARQYAVFSGLEGKARGLLLSRLMGSTV
jgi:hypothetical protein